MIGVKRALVDLAKDRNGVAGIGTKHEGGLIRDWRLEREFGTRKYADSHRTILRRGESSCAGAEVVCDEGRVRDLWPSRRGTGVAPRARPLAPFPSCALPRSERSATSHSLLLPSLVPS